MTRMTQGLALCAMCLAVVGCKVNKTQEGKMPKVEVNTTKGQLPAFNVEGPKVKVGSKTETVKVPTVNVTTPDHK